MKHRALVVDDDRLMAQTLGEVLEFKGWDVDVAHSGSEAVAAFKSEDGNFDVVLMDVKMPGMDGVDAFKAIKALKPDVKVVLMTAYAAQDRILEAEREGVMRVLSKPVNIQGLLELLAATLNGKKPVLLIDNDAAFLRTMSDVLHLSGYDTVMAASIDDAMRLMAQRKPVAVLLHMHLGTMVPRDAVVALHQLSPAIALILYSGQPGAVRELADGIPHEWIYAYLQKPFAIEQVTGVLDAVRARG